MPGLSTHDLVGVEDLVVGLLVVAVGDLLVVLVAHTVLVGGLINLCEQL